MEREKTLEILKTLADGIDPGTGERFPASSPYQHADIVRALYCAIRAMEGTTQMKSGAQPKPAPENAGHPWSEEEDARLGKAFEAGKSIDELAVAHKRSKWAIESRLVRLGKIAAPPSGFTPRQPRGNAAAAGARG